MSDVFVSMKKFYSNDGKRWFDLVLSTVALFLALPVLSAIYLVVLRRIGRPVIFQQVRPGRNGSPFTLYKFRTMIDAFDENGLILPDCERLIPFGMFLRSTSLDELPALINVIKGDMSLVGPRPLLIQYLDRYSPEQARRHDVKPGITGWAQVNGRNAISWDEKFKLDVWYVDNMSFRVDMIILFKTMLTVFKRNGINEPGVATMSEFMGNHSH